MAPEKRLIDANALGIGKAKREAFDNPAYADGWNSAISIIEQAPTVEAVEVVRCLDCKYREWFEPTGSYYCDLTGVCVKGEHFCSYGERKDNETV